MTDNEITEALEYCLSKNCEDCKECPANDLSTYYLECRNKLREKALDLITRQQAEIERLKEIIEYKDICIKACEYTKSEAIKEFAEKIYTEINEALAQNHKVKVERINKLIARGIKSNDEFCYEIDGKILALRGISEFIDNLVKELVGENDAR